MIHFSNLRVKPKIIVKCAVSRKEIYLENARRKNGNETRKSKRLLPPKTNINTDIANEISTPSQISL